MKVKSFLFENKGIKQTIFKNTFWLGIGTFFSKLLSLVLLIYVARILGAEEYGKFTFALAFAAVFTVIHDFGIPQIIVREFSRNKINKKEFSSVVSLNILLSLVVSFAILFTLLFTKLSPDIEKAVLILGAANIITNFANIFISLFQAQGRMEARTWIEILRAVLLVILGLAIIFNFPSAKNLSWAYLIAAAISLPLILIFFSYKFFKPKIKWESLVWKKFLIMSWPLALVGVSGIIYNYIDSIMMGFWGMITETGFYNAAFRIINAAVLPSVLVSKSAYQVLSKFSESKELLQKTWDHQLELMILLAFPMMAGGFVLAPRIIHAFYPDNFSPAVLALQILILSIFFIYISRPFGDLIVVSNQQRKLLLISTAGAIINIILNFILIPRYSLYGAALATVITTLITFLIYIITVKIFTSIHIFSFDCFIISILSTVSALIMYLAVKQPFIYNLNIFISISLGTIIYFLVFLGVKFLLESLKILNYGR